jgi:hypothetical protein
VAGDGQQRGGWAALWLAAVVAAVYLPDLGQGFIKDDFAWIRGSRLASAADVVRLVTEPASGFFRPVVGLSFGLNERLFGLHAFGYGATNLLLLAVCAAGIWRLAAALGLPPIGRIVAASVWSLNFHGINLALLWISGRTALLLCAAATWAADALVRGRPLLAGVLAFVAMLSKEEAVLLPAVFAAWIAIRHDGPLPARIRAAAGAAWPAGVALGVYAVLRVRTSAMTFANAPSFYQARTDAGTLVDNLLEYADRSATSAALVTLAALLVARRRPVLDTAARRTLAGAAVWVAGLFAITVWLPVRSSLYAVTPAVGAALAAATIASVLWDGMPASRRRATGIAALVLPVLLWPVYHARNQRLANEARLSASAMATLTALRGTQPPVEAIVLADDRAARPSLYHAFGSLAPDAVALALERPIPVSLDNTPEDLSRPVPEGPGTRRFRLSDGSLVAIH